MAPFRREKRVVDAPGVERAPATTHIAVLAGRATDGTPRFEPIEVEVLGDETYRLLWTPGLVLNLARGDVFTWAGGEAEPVVTRRGGMVGIHVVGPHHLADHAVGPARALGGDLDGQAHRVTCFAIPVGVGFEPIESLFQGLERSTPS